jgi:TusE/DsrC/DsvC family sulfur relay protein
MTQELAIIEILGKSLGVDADGNLVNLADWNEELAVEIARIEGINELTSMHWQVINCMRRLYTETGEVPTIRKITRSSGICTKEIYSLFPHGPAKKAARIAGLPKPKGCV